ATCQSSETGDSCRVARTSRGSSSSASKRHSGIAAPSLRFASPRTTRSGPRIAVAAERITGVILAGGQATRLGGQPKGLEALRGVRIIDRIVAALRGVSDDLLLSANDPAAVAWLPGIRTVADVRPGVGSLGGIYSALIHSGGPVIVVAWDMPFVTSSL